MTAALLAAHILAAIILIGPITVAASVFPRYLRAAADPDGDRSAALGSAAAMHRITRGYAIPALAVPVFGVATGAALHVLTQPWLIVSMALTVVAAALLAFAIVPAQRAALDRLRGGSVEPAEVRPFAARLGMVTGAFATVWAVVVVLMILRPGSTTGV